MGTSSSGAGGTSGAGGVSGPGGRRVSGVAPSQRVRVGAYGEQVVADAYLKAGFQVVGRNFRTRAGEVDVIALRDGQLVVCEVKTRSHRDFGFGAEAVDWRKQARIRAVTAAWIDQECGPELAHRRPRSIRFDIAVVELRAGSPPHIELIQAAF